MKTNKAIAYSYEETNPMSNFQGDLHTTLPMEDLIGLFESEISEIVAYDSFEYEHSNNAIHIFRGTPKLHKCHYKINTANLELGQITLTRKSPFEEEEMLTVERALGALSIHLNNAFEYQADLEEGQLNSLKIESKLSSID